MLKCILPSGAVAFVLSLPAAALAGDVSVESNTDAKATISATAGTAKSMLGIGLDGSGRAETKID